MAHCFLEKINSNKALNQDEKEALLEDLIFNTKDKDGKTLLEGIIASCDNRNLENTFVITSKYPKLHTKTLIEIGNILNSRNFTDPGKKGKIKETINDNIYHATARDERVSIKDSIDILKANEDILYEQNQQILEILEEGEAEIIEYLPEALESSAAQKNPN